MGLTLVAAPELQPVSLELAKAHLRIDSTAEDIVVQGMIDAATQMVDGPDGNFGLALLTQTWDLWLGEFPCGSVIELPLRPVQTITYLQYTDSDGVLQTVDTDDYVLDSKSMPPLIVPAYGASWEATQDIRNAVNVRFVAGFGDAVKDVPQRIIQAILLTVGHWYENRGASGAALPEQIDDVLLAPYRRYWKFG